MGIPENVRSHIKYYKHSMDSMDYCRTEISIQLKTCKAIQSCCFGTRPTSSRGHSADRQGSMVAKESQYENKCKSYQRIRIKIRIYSYSAIRIRANTRRAVFVANNSFGAKTTEYSANTNTNEYRPILSLFVFGEYEYTAIPDLHYRLASLVIG
jgi:hypothetical protein